MSIVFTNVPGPRVPLVIKGLKSTGILFYVPGLENIGTGISIMTHYDTLKVCCNSDESQI